MKKLMLLTLLLISSSFVQSSEQSLLEKYQHLSSDKSYFQDYTFEQMRDVLQQLNEYAQLFMQKL